MAAKQQENYWEDDEDEDDTPPAPPTDTDLVRQLRKQLRKRDTEFNELNGKFTELSKKEDERTVQSILVEKNVNAKAARLILKDIDSVTPEAINAWLLENGDMFGVATPPRATAPVDLDGDDLDEYQRQDATGQGGMTADALQNASQKIDNASSAEELLSMLQNGRF